MLWQAGQLAEARFAVSYCGFLRYEAPGFRLLPLAVSFDEFDHVTCDGCCSDELFDVVSFFGSAVAGVTQGLVHGPQTTQSCVGAPKNALSHLTQHPRPADRPCVKTHGDRRRVANTSGIKTYNVIVLRRRVLCWMGAWMFRRIDKRLNLSAGNGRELDA